MNDKTSDGVPPPAMPEQTGMQDRDFTGGNIASIPEHQRTSVGDVSIDQTISNLVDSWLGDNPRSDLVSELVMNALKVGNLNKDDHHIQKVKAGGEKEEDRCVGGKVDSERLHAVVRLVGCAEFVV